MIRYFYSICFLVVGTALPVLAKNMGTDNPAPPASSKAGSREVLRPNASTAPTSALAKDQKNQKSEVIVTPDISRGTISASQPAKQELTQKERSLSSAPVTVHSEFHAITAASPASSRASARSSGSATS